MDRDRWAVASRRIGALIRRVRKECGDSQAEVAEILGTTQFYISKVESGQSSLLAEHLLYLMARYNIALHELSPELGYDPDAELAKAMSALGARHLEVDPEVLPSSMLIQPDVVVREVLLKGRPAHLVAALAPVVVTQYAVMSWPLLWADLANSHYAGRLGWLLEGLVEALRTHAEALGTLRSKPLQRHIQALEGLLSMHPSPSEAITDPVSAAQLGALDCLDDPTASSRTRRALWDQASTISRRWGVLTAMRTADFVAALKASGSAS